MPSLFPGLTSPLGFTDLFNLAGRQMHPTGSALAVAGYSSIPTVNQAAIVVGNEGRTIVNGFVIEEVTQFSDSVRLAQNELAFLMADVLTVVQQPTAQTVRQGANVTNSVGAVSRAGLPTYQWRFNGTNLPGATNSNLIITNVQPAHEGVYSALVSDPQRSIASSNATLTVLTRPTLVGPVPPLNLTAALGEPVTLGVQVDGTLPIFCRWRVFRTGGQQALSDQILTQRLSFLTFTAAMNSAGTYVVHLTNSAGGSVTQSHTNAFLTILADADSDGLPDAWEAAYPAAADPALDADSDGVSNRDEYRAGTNPTNASSYLKIDGVELASPARDALLTRFEAVSNKTYSLQCRNAVDSGTWSNVMSIVARATNWNATATNPIAPGTGQRFYRMVTTPRQP